MICAPEMRLKRNYTRGKAALRRFVWNPERAYDEITRLLATTLAVRITTLNLLDAERAGFKSCAGICHRST